MLAETEPLLYCLAPNMHNMVNRGSGQLGKTNFNCYGSMDQQDSPGVILPALLAGEGNILQGAVGQSELRGKAGGGGMAFVVECKNGATETVKLKGGIKLRQSPRGE